MSKLSEIEAELMKQASANEAVQKLIAAMYEEQKRTNELLAKQQKEMEQQRQEMAEIKQIQEALIHKDYEATAQLVNGMGAKNTALYAFDKNTGQFCKMEGQGELRKAMSIGDEEMLSDLQEGKCVSFDGNVIVPYMKDGELIGVVAASDVSNPQEFAKKITEGRLGEAIGRNIQEGAEDVERSNLEQQRNAFEIMATTDNLTSLQNRNGYERYLKTVVLPILQEGGSVSLIMIDGDRFKEINDEYGHNIGDKVLQSIAEAMEECVRDSDCAARIGGDEFMIIGDMDEKAAYEVAERVRQRVADTLIKLKASSSSKQIMASISTGASTIEATPAQREMLTVDTIVSFVKQFKEEADDRLYQAKRGAGLDESGRPTGKNQTVADEKVMAENDDIRVSHVRSLNPMNLDVLVNDKSPKVRAEVVKALRDSDLDRLARDNDHDVQMAVVEYGREQDLRLLLDENLGTQYEDVWKAAGRQLALLEISQIAKNNGFTVTVDKAESKLIASDTQGHTEEFKDLQDFAIAIRYNNASELEGVVAEVPVKSFDERQRIVWQNNPYLRADNYRPENEQDARLKNLYGNEDRRNKHKGEQMKD